MVDVIGIGALNVNFIKAFSLREARLRRLFLKEYLPGRETWATDEEIDRLLYDFGISSFNYVGPGGSAYHTIHCLAQLKLDMKLGYVGVSGAPITAIRGCDLRKSISDYEIDSTFVFNSNNPSGRTISFNYTGTKSRSNRTAPGANNELSVYLANQSIREGLIKYLIGAKWIHVTSFVDRQCMMDVAAILREAKSQNHRLIISFDPGSEYCRSPLDTMHAVLNICDYLFVNSLEFHQLPQLEEIAKHNKIDNHKVAKAIYEKYDCHNSCIIVQSTNYYSINIFKHYKNEVIGRSIVDFPRIPIPVLIREDTGAGGIFAAGFIASNLIPSIGFDLKTAISFGNRLVRAKLRNNSFENDAEYQSAIQRTLKEVAFREKLRFWPIVRSIIIGLIGYALGVLSNIIANIIANDINK